MKKIYTTLFLSSIMVLSFAQQRIAKENPVNVQTLNSHAKTQPIVQPMNVIDTITNHWDVIFPQPVQIDVPVTYSSSNGGYVAGQNGYGDLAKAQKFDPAYGITSANGTITHLLLWFGAKEQIAGTAAFTAKIWADNAGVPGTVLGTAPVFTIDLIDTAAAALSIIGPATAIEGAFNVVATFGTPIAIPANQTFWAGISFTYANGDSAGLVTSQDITPGDAPGLTGDFLDAQTYTFEEWSDNSWWSFNDGTGNTWRLDIALAIYPVVDFILGVNENNGNIVSLQNVPNPAVNNTVIHYTLKEAGDVSISVFDITGKKILSQSHGVQTAGNHQMKLDVSDLTAGMYFYTLNAGSNKMTSKMTIVK